MKLLWVLLLTIALLLESSITTLPLVLLVLLSAAVSFKNNFVLLLGFVFGFFLDISTFQTLGLSSIFFEVFVFLVLMYQSKFEIATNNFIIAASFFGSLCYLITLGFVSNLIPEIIISTLLGLLIFRALKRIIVKPKPHE